MFIYKIKLKSLLPRLGVLLVLLSFGVMTGFSPVLHAHELDFNASHDDCAPCHWSQSSQSVETATIALTAVPTLQFPIFSPTEPNGQQFEKNILNRGPPLFL